MNHRVVWPIAGVLALGVLVFGLSTLSAQRPGEGERGPRFGGMGMGMAHGRFAVAHATAERVLILDTSTGQVFVANEKDFKKASDLQQHGERGRPGVGDRDGDRPRPREKDARQRDKEPRRDREDGREKDPRREKEEKREEKRERREDPR